MPIKIRFAGAKNSPHHFQRIILKLLTACGYDVVVEEGEKYDVLVHHCNSVVSIQGDFYVDEINTRLNDASGKTLIVSGENSQRIHCFMPPKAASLLWRLFKLLIPSWMGKMYPTRDRYFYTVMQWIFNLRCRMKSIKEADVFRHWDEYRYYRTKFSDYVKNLPAANNYALLTNTTPSARAENIFSLPFFLMRLMPDAMQDFISVKQGKLYERKSRFCAFLVSDSYYPAILSYKRVWFCLALSQYKKIDSYGAVLHNTSISVSLLEKYIAREVDLSHFSDQDIAQLCRTGNHPDCGTVTRHAPNQELYRDYKFVICFENSVAEDYITEKLPNAMLGNSIAIYHGAPNVGAYFNTKSFINCADYPDYAAVIRRVIELDQDDEQYQKMLREPFFVNNQIPPSITSKEKELKQFLDRIFVHDNAQKQ